MNPPRSRPHVSLRHSHITWKSLVMYQRVTATHNKGKQTHQRNEHRRKCPWTFSFVGFNVNNEHREKCAVNNPRHHHGVEIHLNA